MAKNVTIRPNQMKAIEIMLSAGNIDEAAAAAGVARQTVYRWLKEPDFIEAMGMAESEALRLAATRFAGAVEVALDTILDILNNSQSDKNRLAAARAILSSLQAIRDMAVLEARIEALESRLE